MKCPHCEAEIDHVEYYVEAVVRCSAEVTADEIAADPYVDPSDGEVLDVDRDRSRYVCPECGEESEPDNFIPEIERRA